MKQALDLLVALWLVVAAAALRAEDIPMADLAIGDGSGWTFGSGT